MELILFTAFSFGLFSGFLPGPMLTSGFMTIVKNSNGFQKVLPFPLIAGFVEICIGLALLYIGKEFFTSTTLLIISILGILNILYMAYKIFSTRKTFSLFSSDANLSEKENTDYMTLSYKDAFIMTLLNGPLYMFWLTVCLPFLLQAEKEMVFGGTYFVFLMVFGVAISTWILFFLMHKSRKYLQNPKLMKIIPVVISSFFVLIAGKMLIVVLGLL